MSHNVTLYLHMLATRLYLKYLECAKNAICEQPLRSPFTWPFSTKHGKPFMNFGQSFSKRFQNKTMTLQAIAPTRIIHVLYIIICFSGNHFNNDVVYMRIFLKTKRKNVTFTLLCKFTLKLSNFQRTQSCSLHILTSIIAFFTFKYFYFILINKKNRPIC